MNLIGLRRGAVSKTAPLAEGGAPQPAVPFLVQQKGGEAGIRTTCIPGLQTTVAYWFLFSNGELTFDGDTGDTVPGPQSVRYGLEISNYYEPTNWLTCNADFALSQARFQDPGANGGQYVPESVGMVMDAGIVLFNYNGADRVVPSVNPMIRATRRGRSFFTDRM